MEVFPHMLQYLQCVSCQKLLGEGSLKCALGHTYCAACARAEEQCQTCLRYTPDLKNFSSHLQLNTNLISISKKCFSRCKQSFCRHLVPMYSYEAHAALCQNIPSEVPCIYGCGIMTKTLGKHLIKKHGQVRGDIFENNRLRIYSNETSLNPWGQSKWADLIIFITPTLGLFLSPKVENGVFTLALYNLSPKQIRLKITAKKGWNKLKFQGVVPFFEETLLKTADNVFWNCELNTLEGSFVEYDSSLGKKYLDLLIIKLD